MRPISLNRIQKSITPLISCTRSRIPLRPFRPPSGSIPIARRYLSELSPLQAAIRSHVGAEPGLDPQRVDGQALEALRLGESSVDVVEYDEDNLTVQEANGFEENRRLLEQPREIEKGVRWINVEGISWDTIKLLAIKYDLHPLALEDCLHGGISTRPKAEYFSKHLFVTLPLHMLAPSERPGPTKMRELYERSRPLERFRDGRAEASNAVQQERRFSPSGVQLDIQLFSIFLLRDGTIITIFEHPQPEVLEPIMARLRERGTVLRSSADASMLLQALLDVVVDHALAVVEAFREQLGNLERRVLEKPNMESVKALHRLRSDLLLLKRQLSPLHVLVSGIKDHDLERAAVTFKPGETPSGFCSLQARVYLSDVQDHVDSVLSSLDMFSLLAQNLVDYSFNLTTFRTNASMKSLTTITVTFLPLSFLTGYFGMNFEDFPQLHNPVDYFWRLAIPVTAALALGFSWPMLRSKATLARGLWARSGFSRIQDPGSERRRGRPS